MITKLERQLREIEELQGQNIVDALSFIKEKKHSLKRLKIISMMAICYMITGLTEVNK